MTLGINLPGNIYLDDPLDVKPGHALAPLGVFISDLLPYLFVAGGLILLAMLIWGGFDILTSVGDEEKMKGGAARIKNALIGALLLFTVYWLAQIAQVLFKIQIL